MGVKKTNLSICIFVYSRTGTSIAVQKLNDRDRTLGMKLYIARQAAIANGNDRQIELLEERWAEAEAEAKRAAGR